MFQLIHGSLTSLSLKHVSTYIHSVFLFFPYGNSPPPFTKLRHRLLAACRVHRAYSVFWLYNSTIGPPSKSRPHDGCVCTGRKEGVFVRIHLGCCMRLYLSVPTSGEDVAWYYSLVCPPPPPVHCIFTFICIFYHSFGPLPAQYTSITFKCKSQCFHCSYDSAPSLCRCGSKRDVVRMQAMLILLRPIQHITSEGADYTSSVSCSKLWLDGRNQPDKQ
jgi:hypothetical protein